MANQHRLSNINPDSRLGDCAICGEGVPLLFRRGRARWLCREARRARDRNSNNSVSRIESRRRHYLGSNYGLSPQEYEALLARQLGGCAICGRSEGAGDGRRLAVDHDHETNVIRGLLCNRCNRALGLFCDSQDHLHRALSYLEKAKSEAAGR